MSYPCFLFGSKSAIIALIIWYSLYYSFFEMLRIFTSKWKCVGKYESYERGFVKKNTTSIATK